MDTSPVFSASRARRAAALLACVGVAGTLAACANDDPNVYRPAPRYTGAQPQPAPVYRPAPGTTTTPTYTSPAPAPTYTPPSAPPPAPGGQAGCGAKCG